MKELEEVKEMLNTLANRLYSLVMECDEMIERIDKLQEPEEKKDD